MSDSCVLAAVSSILVATRSAKNQCCRTTPCIEQGLQTTRREILLCRLTATRNGDWTHAKRKRGKSFSICQRGKAMIPAQLVALLVQLQTAPNMDAFLRHASTTVVENFSKIKCHEVAALLYCTAPVLVPSFKYSILVV